MNLYDAVEANDVVLHFTKMINEETGIFCCANTATVDQLRRDLLSMATQLNAANEIIKEWGISNEPPIKIKSHKIAPLCVSRGDTMTVKVTGKESNHSISSKIGINMVIDNLSIYSFTDALGFNNAVMGVFGESK